MKIQITFRIREQEFTSLGHTPIKEGLKFLTLPGTSDDRNERG